MSANGRESNDDEDLRDFLSAIVRDIVLPIYENAARLSKEAIEKDSE